MAAWMHGILVPANSGSIVLLLEDHRLIGWHEVRPAQALGHSHHLRRAKQFERRRLPLVVHIVDAEHSPSRRALGKDIIILVGIISAGMQSHLNPCLPGLLDTPEHIPRNPVAQDEVAIFIEKAYLLLRQK